MNFDKPVLVKLPVDRLDNDDKPSACTDAVINGPLNVEACVLVLVSGPPICTALLHVVMPDTFNDDATDSIPPSDTGLAPFWFMAPKNAASPSQLRPEFTVRLWQAVLPEIDSDPTSEVPPPIDTSPSEVRAEHSSDVSVELPVTLRSCAICRLEAEVLPSNAVCALSVEDAIPEAEMLVAVSGPCSVLEDVFDVWFMLPLTTQEVKVALAAATSLRFDSPWTVRVLPTVTALFVSRSAANTDGMFGSCWLRLAMVTFCIADGPVTERDVNVVLPSVVGPACKLPTMVRSPLSFTTMDLPIINWPTLTPVLPVV